MSDPQKFRKKPVVIEAVRVDDVLYDAARNWKGLPDWIVEAYEHNNQATTGSIVFARDGVHVTTLEGTMVGDRGDWIIRGVAGELYPCKPDIFAATYDDVTHEPRFLAYVSPHSDIWDVHCACGWTGAGMSNAEVREMHRSHVAEAATTRSPSRG